ncbi:amino-acid carrier protein [Corynebacterium kutscheri]|uniref:Amino-acid carrier protein n=1 Tax=Corynebacterium kutscheri TaxID=35755 RepID=A0AB38VSJ6_9CORY|nr:alanine/glycine:cation symporter family protein [Corynebacterium kutscheri]VEH05870.1 amino-acid carrier protein [Corynebacterium kutscheri]VEH81762.1 amino-acid carrier protein [Corynebacterium kutscheri]
MVGFLDTLGSLIWSPALIFLCLGAGLYFTVVTGFLQIRCLPDMLRQLRNGDKSENGISSFQALMLALAGRVGVGNIAGVATAIAFGGPGAVFWMWVVAGLGAATSFIECTLAQIYKEHDRDTGEYRGGPAFYIEKAYQHTKAAPVMVIYAVVFAIAMIIATSYFLPGIQANGIAAALSNAWGVDTRITALCIAVVLLTIIIGGIKRIATFAEYIVPFMAGVYILISVVVMLLHFNQIDDVFLLIFRSAFNLESTFAGLLGAAIMWGVKRGIYSNEAGQGTGPHHGAAAEVSHPAQQGFVQAFSVYVDTLFVCSATAFIIISTDMYKVFSGETEAGAVIYSGSLADGIAVGPGFVQAGLDSLISGVGASFVAIAIAFFAFTTILAYYYLAEVNAAYLNRWVKNKTARRAIIWLLRTVVVLSVVIGAITTPGTAWALGDIGAGTTAWLNIIAILIIQTPALKTFRDYQRQRKQGQEPVFDPERLGIKNADFWVERNRQKTHQTL